MDPDRFAARLRRGDRRNEHVRQHQVQAVLEPHPVAKRRRHLLDAERPEPEREDMEEYGKDQVEGVYAAEILDRRLIDGEVEDATHNKSAKPDRNEQPLPLRLLHSSRTRLHKADPLAPAGTSNS